MRLRHAIAVTASGLGAVIALQNRQPVALELFAWRVQAPLAVWVVVALAIGLVTGWVIGRSWRRH